MILEGIRVLDFSMAIYGPLAGRILGDLGAEVIKVEPNEGDFARLTASSHNDSILFLTYNRNKKSIALNLREAQGLEIARKLAQNSDVIIQNFRPGVMKRLGLDYENIRKINPQVIYGSFSMYGETGPLAHRRGADIWAQAFTGMVNSQGMPNEPQLVAHPVIDVGGAVLNALGLVSALFYRERSGKGQEVTSNMVNAGTFLQENSILHYLIDGTLFEKPGRGPFRGTFPYGPYPAKDGDVVTIFGQDDDEWKAICDLLGTEYLLDIPEYATAELRTIKRFELYPILDEAFRKKTMEEWQLLFQEKNLRCDPCQNYQELVEHPQFIENDMLFNTEHSRDGSLQMIAPPIKFSGQKEVSNRPPPVIGEHTSEILKSLGYSQDTIHELDEQGVVRLATPDMFVGDGKRQQNAPPPTRLHSKSSNKSD
ncbi:CaiB/BaiF CoA transferase family protein [Chloroflexota bacterium]